MHPPDAHSIWIAMGGTALEVAGTFLLAVEAIKIENLKRLRERVLMVAALRVNPIIQFVDQPSEEERKRAGERWFNVLLCFFIGIGLLFFYVVLRISGHSLVGAWALFSSFVPGPLWVDLVVAIPTGFVLLLLASVAGTSTYTLVVIALEAAIRLLSFIERNTASGVIGIMGFLLFLLGAGIRTFLEWKRV